MDYRQSAIFLSQFLKNVSLKNFVNLSLNQGINVVTALVITPFLFQRLEEQYGLVALGFTVILLFGLLVNYGFNLNIPGKLALVKADRKALELMINEVLDNLSTLFYSEEVSKEQIVNAMKSYLPNFNHIEKGKNLDQSM